MWVRQEYKRKQQGHDRDQQCGPRDQCGRRRSLEGRKAEKAQREFLYQGISSRPFKRQFNLADYVQVKGAAFDNGLLQIELVREIPAAMKPRRRPRPPDRRHSADIKTSAGIRAAEARWCLVPGLPDAWTRCILHH